MDARQDAYERYIDHQLSEPSFGERWVHVWLNLARYTDSDGDADDPQRKKSENKPFDQFTIEQVAVNLLENRTDEQLIATAFIANR